ncbi:hypothetical protein [Halomicronema sp. CCY15110]|uniref:hypothetical protein n=1 Tax=Halomicronema sp. CCY15110 TaxID=2767773 RepID=UPI00194F8540|nr:hypothetical protein [Halomicronema sp. CCY15110]
MFNRIPKSPGMPFCLRPVAKKIMTQVQAQFLDPQLQTNLAFIEASLQDQDWLARDFSAADIQMSFPLEIASDRTRPCQLISPISSLLNGKQLTSKIGWF